MDKTIDKWVVRFAYAIVFWYLTVHIFFSAMALFTDCKHMKGHEVLEKIKETYHFAICTTGLW